MGSSQAKIQNRDACRKAFAALNPTPHLQTAFSFPSYA
jgi:hypothetical protein